MRYHEKGLGKTYSMVMFPETLTETITIKNMKLTSNMVYANEKHFNN